MDAYTEHFVEPALPVQSSEEEASAIAPLQGNRLEPMYHVKSEKYEHRIVAFHKAAGMTDKEVAEATGLHPVTIGYLKKQPWFEQLVLEEIHRKGQEALDYLSQHSLKAAQRLVEISENAANEETRRKANNDILDRRYGKPNQPMSVSNKKADELSDEELMKIIGNKN
jgi:hypothetical protein